VFILGSLVQLAGPWLTAVFLQNASGAGWLAQVKGLLAALPVVAVLLAYIFVVFGFLSRRCERQADLYGCRAVSCLRPDCDGHGPDAALGEHGRGLCPTGIHTFVRALEKVAVLNGISRDRPGFLQSWQHSTIARRVDFLHRVLYDPAEERLFQRRVTLVKWALIVVLGGTLAVLVHTSAL
jgi:STE24 endopeptidase